MLDPTDVKNSPHVKAVRAKTGRPFLPRRISPSAIALDSCFLPLFSPERPSLSLCVRVRSCSLFLLFLLLRVWATGLGGHGPGALRRKQRGGAVRGLGRRGGPRGVFADGRRLPREELLPRRKGGAGGQAPASEPPSGGRCWTDEREPDDWQGHEVVGEGDAAEHEGGRVRARPRRLPAQCRRQARRRRLLLPRLRWLPRSPPQDCSVRRAEPGRVVPASQLREAQVHVLQPPCPCPPFLQVLQGSSGKGQQLQLHQCNHQEVQGRAGEALTGQVQPRPGTRARGGGALGSVCKQGPGIHLQREADAGADRRGHPDGSCLHRRPMAAIASGRDAAAHSGIREQLADPLWKIVIGAQAESGHFCTDFLLLLFVVLNSRGRIAGSGFSFCKPAEALL